MNRKILSFVLAIMMLALSAFTATVANADGTTEHKNFVNGYSDGLFHPNDTISRAEAAQIFYNLNPQYRGGERHFADVKVGAWYADAVVSLSSAGIMNGYSDGTFKPMKAVTRAEFVAIMAALSGKNPTGAASFADVPPSHWASGAIALAESSGWVKGSNGLFRPDDSMTRAEAVTAINRFLARVPDKTAIDLDPTARYFPDITPDEWYYYDIMEAAVSHTCTVTATGELWTGITRYPTVLPDGFAIVSGSVRLIKNGYFTCEAGRFTFRGTEYESDEHGAVTTPDGALRLSDGTTVIIKDGSVATEDGLYYTADGLYCISDGALLTDGYYMTLYFGSDGRYTSGNAEIDDFVETVVASVVTDEMTDVERLRACYDYIYNNVNYRANNNHVPRGSAPEEWTEEYMLRLIDTGKGNCYCFAAEMYYLARRVGFATAATVSGGVSQDNLDHGWMTVTVDGVEYLLDPELDKSSGPYPGSAFMVTYDYSPFRYFTKVYD